jgi:hypothetical protein
MHGQIAVQHTYGQIQPLNAACTVILWGNMHCPIVMFLHGMPCLYSAIDKRVNVTASSRNVLIV